MQIDIKNFGPINEFSYDLTKDLIVTYGDNNIGKSYAMQVVYLLIKNLIEYCSIGTRYIGNFYVTYGIINEDTHDKCEHVVKGFIDKKSKSIDITQGMLDILYDTLSDAIIQPFMNSCDNTFGNFERTLEKAPIISLKSEKYNFNFYLKEGKIRGNAVIKPIYLKKTDTDFFKSKNFENYEAVYVSYNNIDKPINVLVDIIRKLVNNFIIFINKNFESVYFLPASRSGIYTGMNAFGSIIAELSKNRAYLTKKIVLPAIPEPISDYFINLSGIKQKVNEKYSKFYSKIEDIILKGKVSFDKTKNSIVYVPNELEMEFEMTEVSSMVSEVSPIVAFLKYILVNQNRKTRFSIAKSILFIEEPEAHLHPNNQIELIEIFAELASAGVKLIISSHSNYVFNKLNNLVLSKKLDYRIYQPIFLEMTNDGSFSKVMNIDELGADDENFVDVSQKLYFEREEIIQKLDMGEE